MTAIKKFLRGTTNGASAIAGIFMVTMMFHIVTDVLSKWLFNYPIDGTLEFVSNYYMVGLIFLPLAYVQRAGGHIIVEIFTQNLARKLRLVLDAAIGLFMAIYTAVFVWYTAVEAVRKTAEHEFLEATNTFIIIWPVRWLLPIGFGVMGLIALYQTFLSLHALRTGGGPVTGRGGMD